MIGIVDAFHYGRANSDLSVFSAEMGLPQCTIANGCFKQVNQLGGAPRASGNSNWELETMLDLEYAHAMAPNAKLVLVEGDDNSFINLNIAVATALNVFNVDVLSNSYGTVTFPGEQSLDGTYMVNKPILFSSGDEGTPTSVSMRFRICDLRWWNDAGGECPFQPGQRNRLGRERRRVRGERAGSAVPDRSWHYAVWNHPRYAGCRSNRRSQHRRRRVRLRQWWTFSRRGNEFGDAGHGRTHR